MSSNLSEKIQQVIVHENRNFEKVITDVADGFNRCGFFNEVPDWKNTLIQCFDRKRLGLPSGDIRSNTTVHTSVLSEDSFRRGLVAQSTPLVAGRTNTQTLRNKRPPTLPDDGGQREAARTPKRAKSSLNEMEAARILVDLRRTDWERILPPVNEEQKAARYENVFEKSRRLIGLATPFRNRRTDDIIATQMSMLPDRNPADVATTQTSTLPATPNNPITKRRNAVFIPAVKHSMDPVPVVQRKTTLVTQPVSTESGLVVRRKTAPATKTGPKGSKKAKSTNVNPSAPTNQADNGVLTNITNRRLTRKQTHLLAAYSGTNANLGLAASISDRRGTGYFKRTSVLFTMVDAAQYKRILQTYNIFVADNNEKYDYVITERICRSPKFLSAVVSGKPILSVEWLHAMDEKKIWLDPLTYLLKDDEGEKEYGFNLSDTLLKATNKRLFENYSILVTTHTKISPESLKDVIFSGGGKFLKTTLVPRRGDECICISDEVDKKTWPTLLKKYSTLKKIISLDGFSKMIFRYTHDVSPTDILHQI